MDHSDVVGQQSGLTDPEDGGAEPDLMDSVAVPRLDRRAFLRALTSETARRGIARPAMGSVASIGSVQIVFRRGLEEVQPSRRGRSDGNIDQRGPAWRKPARREEGQR